MDHYTAANTVWPEHVPPITREEARRASRKLARHFGGRPRREPRRCWIALSTPTNTIRRGWRRLVHDVSHIVWRGQSPASRPHNKWHADLELEMAEYVIAQGWLTGSLKAAPREHRSITPDQKLATVLLRIKRWETKKKRAETALSKLRKRVRYYERKVSA